MSECRILHHSHHISTDQLWEAKSMKIFDILVTSIWKVITYKVFRHETDKLRQCVRVVILNKKCNIHHGSTQLNSRDMDTLYETADWKLSDHYVIIYSFIDLKCNYIGISTLTLLELCTFHRYCSNCTNTRVTACLQHRGGQFV